MKLSKVAYTGLLAVAMISTACNNENSNDTNIDELDTTLLNESPDHSHDMDNHNHGADGHEHHSGELTMGDDTTEIPNETSELVEREEVKLALLPPAVTEELGSEEYLDWKIERAFKMEKDGVKSYEIVVTKDGENATLHFNEKGIRLDR